MMRFSLISYMLVLFCTQLTAQSVELQSASITPTPLLPVELSGNGSVSFSMIEVSGLNVPAVVSNQPNLSIIVDLHDLAVRDGDVSLISGTLMEYFNVTNYNEDAQVITFSQIDIIPGDISLDVMIPFVVSANSTNVDPSNGFSAWINAKDDNVDAEGSVSTITFTSENGNANDDSDGDGVTDVTEVANGTDPLDPCSLNYADVTLIATDGGDCDGDGVSNADEINGADNQVGGNDATDLNDPCDFNAQSITLAVTAITDCDGDNVDSNSDPDDQDPCVPNPCNAIEIPNGFTPNGDGYNDFFVIEGVSPEATIDVDVFNRWGTKVYEDKNYKNNWDGTSNDGLTSKGSKLPEGTYFYVLTESKSGEEIIHKGYVFLSY